MKPLKLYRSSAGSGKTFTLVKEFLLLSLPDPTRFRRIVAITFTNSAANEMKERIISKLKGIVSDSEDDLVAQLKESGLTHADIENASMLLDLILHKYSWFQIGTIDSFFHKILRSFSKELNLPHDFDLNVETQEALDHTVEKFIQQAHTDLRIQNLLKDFVREKINNGYSWSVRSDFDRMALELIKERAVAASDLQIEDIAALINELKKVVNSFEGQMHEISEKAVQVLKDYNLEVSDFWYKASGPVGYFNKISKDQKDYKPGSYFLTGLEDPERWVKNNPVAREAVNKYLYDYAIKAFDIYCNQHQRYISSRLVLKSIYTFAVYGELQNMLQNYREEESVLLVADFNKALANDVVKEDVQFIYSKIGSRYDHYLIDEFQDTSNMQWTNLKSLVESSISQGAECLLVGDAKQAIYRWRGGDIKIIEKQISESDFPDFTQEQNLESNFRSLPNIVEFNNKFFSDLREQFKVDSPLLEKVFNTAEQNSRHKEAGGFVSVSFLKKEGTKKSEFRELALSRLLEILGDCTQSGYYGNDIAILVRTGEDGKDVSRLLNQYGYKFISYDSLSLEHSIDIRLLLSTLAYLADARNAIAEKACEELLRVYYPGKSNATHIISENFNRLSTDCVFNTICNLIDIFGIETDAYVARFKEVAFEFIISKNKGISSFLEWYNKSEYSIILPEDRQAIQVMTIHKSKGLEFPVVIIPFADWDTSVKSQDLLWVESEHEPFSKLKKFPVLTHRDLEDSYFERFYSDERDLNRIDNFNLLYVAFTRPMERLYVISEANKSGVKISSTLMKILWPDCVNPEDRQIQFGEPASPCRNEKSLGVEIRKPDFNRKSVQKGNKALFFNEFPEPEVFRKAELACVSLTRILVPGYGPFAPEKAVQKGDTIFTLTHKSELSKGAAHLSAVYKKYLENITGKKVVAYCDEVNSGVFAEV